MATRASSWLGKLHGSASEAQRVAKADKIERAAAQTILYPKEVDGRDWDAQRALQTTMGGKLRPITRDDLITFRKIIKGVQKHFKDGIRPRQVIDLSLNADRERARQQIRIAVPVAAKDGVVRFITNAGPGSKVQRHHVTVQFLSYGAAATAGRASPRTMASWMRKEPLKFDCDCGRHRYWFRYISTIGGFNAGRPETGYPKEKNPGLHGVACKHVLRVMAEIESSVPVLLFLTRLLERARDQDDVTAKVAMTQKEAQDLAEKQAKRARSIDTTEVKDLAKRAKATAARGKQALIKAIKSAPPPKQAAQASRNAAKAKESKQAIAMLAKEYGMTQKDMVALLERNRKA